MGQTRFHNFQRPLVSYDENLRLFGFIAPGRICGFDTVAIVGGNTLSISHAGTGWINTNLDGSPHSIRGVSQSRQGNFIHEDAAIQVNVDFNATANDRIDLLVMEHTFLDSPGGAAAIYSVIKGVLTGAQEPALSSPLIQVIIGRFLIKAGAVDHTNTIYEPAEPRLIGGANAITKFSENEIQDGTAIVNPGRVIVGAQTLGDFNRLSKTGMFRLITVLNRPTTDTNEWFVVVMRKGNQVVQLALSKLTGKTYTRSSADIGATWQAWQNLNTSDISPLIGDLNYSSNIFVADLDSLTVAIGKLDNSLASEGAGRVAADLLRVLKAGDSMTGALAMGGNKIVGLAAATAAGEAVRFEQLPIATLITTVVNIGVWDMNANYSAVVPLGVPRAKIRSLKVIIRTDDFGGGEYVTYDLLMSGYWEISNVVIPADNVTLQRTAAGWFQSLNYDQVAGWNRGWVVVESIP